MQPKIYTSEQHHIRNDLIDSHALTVLKKLHEAGHTAYLVGGGVRDLLMRKRPKDFDISTSARPEEVKKIFHNCILIGRRFRLAHVRFGSQIIEVSTFRSGDPLEEDLIVRDNIWGTPEEDVMRRDFTINGLFYDPLDHKIIDYVGGFEDLQKHYLRVIGDPLVRFRQDPVRMIRMQKFRARFGFQVQTEALEALSTCRQEIRKSSPARVLEEIFRMLESGSSEPFFRLLAESQFLKIIFPELDFYFHSELSDLIYSYLKSADAMNLRGRYKTLDRAVLTASILYPILEREVQVEFLEKEKIPNITEIIGRCNDLIHRLLTHNFSHFPRKIRLKTLFILQMQYRLTPIDKKKRPPLRVVKHPEFQEALVFLKLRALIDHKLFKAYDYWKRTQNRIENKHADAKSA